MHCWFKKDRGLEGARLRAFSGPGSLIYVLSFTLILDIIVANPL